MIDATIETPPRMLLYWYANISLIGSLWH